MEIVRVRDHNVNQTYAYLFDTNVWLHIYGPVAGSTTRKQQVYSSLLNEILSRKAVLYVTSLNLSEYVNVVLKMGFKQWKRATNNYNANFKTDYRPTDDYKTTLEDAVAQVEDILKITTHRPDDFNAIKINDVLEAMKESSDYNDAYFVKCCERGGIKFVSDDNDITNITSSITVITE